MGSATTYHEEIIEMVADPIYHEEIIEMVADPIYPFISHHLSRGNNRNGG